LGEDISVSDIDDIRDEPPAADGDDEMVEATVGDDILHNLISDEMGEKIAEVMRIARRAQEAWHRREHPEEGLRERKRRLTRQLISDAATAMFATRGFDNVKVSEVADRVGVSEKTIYNYFPTKESLVLDWADDAVEQMALALRERAPGESITDAVLHAIERDTARFENAPDELVGLLPMFGAMIETTPALRAAWLEQHDRIARVARDELAAEADVDPRDPEPTAAGRALAGLPEVAMDSRIRHIGDGLRGDALRDAVQDDLARAARLLETGLWSFNLPRSARARGQARQAAEAAEQARLEVVEALKRARAAWDQVRRDGRTAEDVRNVKRSALEVRDAVREAHRIAHEAGDAVREVKRESRRAGRHLPR
jgi:AcrR family transcriptional regulator